LVIETASEFTGENGETLTFGKRGNITRLALEFGDVEYDWSLVGSSVYQLKEDDGLETIDKTIIGAINELKNNTLPLTYFSEGSKEDG
jgi:hypothetical protein